MKRTFLNNAGMLLLAIVFSTGLIFAFIELTRLLDAGLQSRFGFPQFDHGPGDVNASKTEMFIQGLHLRWIGCGSLLLIVGLIVIDCLTRRSGWAIAGARDIRSDMASDSLRAMLKQPAVDNNLFLV